MMTVWLTARTSIGGGVAREGYGGGACVVKTLQTFTGGGGAVGGAKESHIMGEPEEFSKVDVVDQVLTCNPRDKFLSCQH